MHWCSKVYLGLGAAEKLAHRAEVGVAARGPFCAAAAAASSRLGGWRPASCAAGPSRASSPPKAGRHRSRSRRPAALSGRPCARPVVPPWGSWSARPAPRDVRRLAAGRAPSELDDNTYGCRRGHMRVLSDRSEKEVLTLPLENDMPVSSSRLIFRAIAANPSPIRSGENG